MKPIQVPVKYDREYIKYSQEFDNAYASWKISGNAVSDKRRYYFDGLIRYEMENCYEEADEINEESFRVVSADGYDDTHLIAFCDIPQEAYFLKLTRID